MPREISFQHFGDQAEGYLTVASGNENIPFDLQRVFWTYATPENISRGRHAHYETDMILVCVHGTIRLVCENLDGQISEFILSDRNKGVFIPRLTWHEMWYSSHAIQLVLASTYFSEADYIRNYEDFCALKQSNPLA